MNLKSVYIPSSVTTIWARNEYSQTVTQAAGPFAFISTTVKIYCERTSAPSGWDAGWNGYNLNTLLSVTYGVSLETYNTTVATQAQSFKCFEGLKGIKEINKNELMNFNKFF